MEEDQLYSDSLHSSQKEPHQKGEESSGQAPLQTSASSSPAKASTAGLDQEENLTKVQEKDSPTTHSQTKPLWRPIPPLLPESHIETKDQSCQTEEQTSTASHGHTGGGKCFLSLIYPPTDSLSSFELDKYGRLYNRKEIKCCAHMEDMKYESPNKHLFHGYAGYQSCDN